MFGVSTAYRFPFCSTLLASWSIHDRTRTNETVWDALSPSCRAATLIVAAVSACLVIGCLLTNLFVIFAACAEVRIKRYTKSDRQSYARLTRYKDSVWMQKTFRVSLAMSGFIAGVLLIPMIIVSAVELLSMQFPYKDETQQGLLVTYKLVASALFHLAVTSSVYNLLGGVLERWITLIRLNPTQHLARISNLVGDASSQRNKRKNRKMSKKSAKQLRRLPVTIFLVVAWVASGALALLSVLLPGVRFLLYGEPQYSKLEFLHPYISFVNIVGGRMRAISVMYICFVYIPVVCLIFGVVLTAVSWLKVKSTARSLDSFEDGEAQAYFAKQQHRRKKSTGKAVDGQKRSSVSKRAACNNLKKSSSRTNNFDRVTAQYSHKLEHSAQVASNCQETDLCQVITDCIQLQPDSAAKGSSDTTTPLPPDWMKYASFKKIDTASSPLKVQDLASTPLSVPVDSAQSFFGELAETKTTLITCSVSTLALLPLLALLALDVLAGLDSALETTQNSVSDSNFSFTLSEEHGKNITISTEIIGNVTSQLLTSQVMNTGATPRYNRYHEVSQITTNLAPCFLLVYVLGTMTPFFSLCATSAIFRKGIKNASKRETRRKSSENSKQDKSDTRAGQHLQGLEGRAKQRHGNRDAQSCTAKARARNNKMSSHSSDWQSHSGRARSKSKTKQHPNERPRSSYLDTQIDIDERYDADVE